jgi:hypothetical protein
MLNVLTFSKMAADFLILGYGFAQDRDSTLVPTGCSPIPKIWFPAAKTG